MGDGENPTMEELLRQILSILKVNYPEKEDEPLFTGGQITLAPSTEATITFEMEEGWEGHVTDIIVDHRDDTTYEFFIAGDKYEDSNESHFKKPKIVRNKFIVKIANNSTGTNTYGYYPDGWGKPIQGAA